MPAPLLIDLSDAMVMVGDGRIVEGVRLLDETIETAQKTSRLWEGFFGRLIKTVMMARIASGEAKADLRAMVRSPLLTARLAAGSRRAESDLIQLRDEAEAIEFGIAFNICDVELARLYIARGEPDRAKPLLEQALAYASRSDVKEGPERIKALLDSV